ncbi:MAG: hypothetical protein K5780_01375 [Alphaproteobacteria bacterium]|nr:hypothetical protein [Alphaproteobacteria bacterium]
MFFSELSIYILKKNIEINELTDKVKIFNIGLSNEKINGSINHYDPENIEGTSIKQDSDEICYWIS